MNLWMKRAIGAAALGGSLPALAVGGLLTVGVLVVRPPGPPPPRGKEVMTGRPAEAAGQHALRVTGR
jgi:hypothetical protein